jgi:HEPN domain-containing protein
MIRCTRRRARGTGDGHRLANDNGAGRREGGRSAAAETRVESPAERALPIARRPARRHIPLMLDRSEYRRWRREADDALKGARLQADGGLHNWACFLAEQSAQLAVKGLLHGVGQGAWGHDLVALGEAMEAALERDLYDHLRSALQRLSRHYIPARYPDAHPSGTAGVHYGPDDVVQALDDVAVVLQYVDERWRALTSGGEASEPGPGAEG